MKLHRRKFYKNGITVVVQFQKDGWVYYARFHGRKWHGDYDCEYPLWQSPRAAFVEELREAGFE